MRSKVFVGGLAGFLATVSSQALADRIEVTTTVEAARIYPDGAEVTRGAAVSAPAGRHDIVIADLPRRIDLTTLRAELAAGQSATLLGLRYAQPQARPEAEDPAREALEAEIRDVEWARRAAEDAEAAAVARRDHAESFRKAAAAASAERGAADLLGALEHWPAAFAQLAEEHAAAQADARAARRQAEDLGRRLEALYAELAALRPPAPRSELVVSIAAEAPIDGAALSISYLTADAAWSPFYDLRLDEAEGDGETGALVVVRRAAVLQRTGEDWDDVTLTLSTARPSGRMAAPDAPSRRARFAPESERRGGAGGYLKDRERAEEDVAQRAVEPMAEQVVGDLAVAAQAPAPAALAAEPSRPAASMLSFEGAAASFTAPEPADLSGDGETAQIFLSEDAADAQLVVRTTPEQDRGAYLYALYQTGALPILPGRASVFRNGAYAGSVSLGPTPPGDAAALPLGPEDAIKVERRVRDRAEGEQGFFQTENRRRASYEITLRNLGEKPRRVTVFDSAPFSEDDAIKVTTDFSPSPSETEVDGRRGAYAWTFTLKPEADKAIRVGHEITWPEGRRIILVPGDAPR